MDGMSGMQAIDKLCHFSVQILATMGHSVHNADISKPLTRFR
jgi:hypothetical protein